MAKLSLELLTGGVQYPNLLHVRRPIPLGESNPHLVTGEVGVVAVAVAVPVPPGRHAVGALLGPRVGVFDYPALGRHVPLGAEVLDEDEFD